MKKTGPPQVEEQPRSTAIKKEFEGEWEGQYELFGYARKVTLKLAAHGNEPGTADFVIVGRKVNNLPVDLVTQEGNLLTVDARQAGVTYEGRLEPRGDEIKGMVLQGPLEMPVVLKKTKAKLAQP